MIKLNELKNLTKKNNSNGFPQDNFERFERINETKLHMKERILCGSILEYFLHSENRRCNYLLAALLLALPPILGLIYIKFFGVNAVFWDQWELVPLIEKMYTGSLNLSDLFSQHNEHRIFFPRIIMLILAYMTHYNNIAEMCFSWILSLATMLLIFRMYLLDSGNSTRTLVKFIPVAWLLFSFRQYENILWGWQIQIYLCILGFVASIYMLEKVDKVDINILLAAFFGVISSFSFINGLLVWPIGLVYLFLAKKIKGKFSLVWAVTGVLVCGIYFYNWIKPPYHPSLFFMLKNPFISMTYFFVNIGSPLSSEKYSAFGNGVLLSTLMLFTFIIIINKQIIIKNIKWVSFILFSLFSSLSLTVGRSGFGIEQALSSRYVTIISLGIIGIYLIFSDLHSRFENGIYKKYSILYGIILSLILVGIIVGYEGNIVVGEQTHDSRELTKSNLINYKSKSDDDLRLLYPSPDILRDRAKILEKYNLNVFCDKWQLEIISGVRKA